MMNEQIVPFGAWLSNTILSANTDDESYCSNREEGGMLREEERRHDKRRKINTHQKCSPEGLAHIKAVIPSSHCLPLFTAAI